MAEILLCSWDIGALSAVLPGIKDVDAERDFPSFWAYVVTIFSIVLLGLICVRFSWHQKLINRESIKTVWAERTALLQH